MLMTQMPAVTLMLTHSCAPCRNSTDKDMKLSLAQWLFGRPICDFIPVYPGQYEPHPNGRRSCLLERKHCAIINEYDTLTN